MHPELEKLVHLQHTEQRILALTMQIAAYPKRVKNRELALATAERELAAIRQSIAGEEKMRRRMDSDTDDLRRKAIRYRAQVETIQNQSQLQALEHEIGFADQEIRRIEDDEIESLMRTEALEEQQQAAQTTVEHRKQQLSDENAEARLAIKRDDEECAVLQQERATIRSTIEKDMLSIYDRLAASRKTAIAEGADQRCSACQMMLRPQKWNELKNNTILYCDSCGRLLYYSAPVDLSDAIALPAAGSIPPDRPTKKPAEAERPMDPQQEPRQQSRD
ncbi:MAG TPA: C4-type zinc ribbon domain-containing protein [Acidobacteriaceae bacterium]|jgi:hypothetical protein|nr:C4-type zinc ribbon domain-containing protein [Acidobacteriaceae bacterium]